MTLELLNNNAAVINVILTLALVISTCIYTFATYKILSEMTLARKSAISPRVSFSLGTPKRTTDAVELPISVSNTGRGSAFSLLVEVKFYSMDKTSGRRSYFAHRLTTANLEFSPGSTQLLNYRQEFLDSRFDYFDESNIPSLILIISFSDADGNAYEMKHFYRIECSDNPSVNFLWFSEIWEVPLLLRGFYKISGQSHLPRYSNSKSMALFYTMAK